MILSGRRDSSRDKHGTPGVHHRANPRILAPLLKRARGIEPLSRSWKDRVIPLYDARSKNSMGCNNYCATPAFGLPGFEPGLNTAHSLSGHPDSNWESLAPKARMLTVTPCPVFGGGQEELACPAGQAHNDVCVRSFGALP